MIGNEAIIPYMQPKIMEPNNMLIAMSGSLNISSVWIGFGQLIFDLGKVACGSALWFLFLRNS